MSFEAFKWVTRYNLPNTNSWHEKVNSTRQWSVFLHVQSYLLEAENESSAVSAETPQFETIAQLTDHLPEIHFASGYKMLEESQSCFEGSLVA